LAGRLVNYALAHDADFASMLGRQEMRTFWERVAHPHVLMLLVFRYGGPGSANRSRRASDKIANGQCILVRRAPYEALGGHAAVRDKVAEDMMLAQTFFQAHRVVLLVEGADYLSTRMYRSLGDLIRGWRKNIFAAGADTMPELDRLPRLRAVALATGLLAPASFMLLPVALLAVSLSRVAPIAPTAPAAAVLLLLTWWAWFYRRLELSALYAFTFPLGAGVMLYLAVTAIARGQRVSWKGREYESA
jgi:hypothetical protein